MSEDAAGAGHAQAPIIIKKKVSGHGGHHGGAWKVAYADMVTALMALFIVLWILGQSDEVKQQVASYFRDPSAFDPGAKMSIHDSSGSSNEFPILDDIPVPSMAHGSEGDGGDDRAREQAESIRTALSQVKDLDKYKQQIEFSVTPEGLRINLLESPESPLFKLGGTSLNSEVMDLVRTLGEAIQNSGNSIVIEGHTDTTPFAAGSDRTNWELSTGRAHTARREFEKAGVPMDRMLEVRGFSDRQLYNPLDSQDSRNRRISITLLSGKALASREDQPAEAVIPWLESRQQDH